MPAGEMPPSKMLSHELVEHRTYAKPLVQLELYLLNVAVKNCV